MNTDKLELVVAEKEHLPVQQSNIVTPMSMLQAAREQNASIEQMQQLMDLQFKWEANEARKAYFKAVADFKALRVSTETLTDVIALQQRILVTHEIRERIESKITASGQRDGGVVVESKPTE